ncbi:MAG: CCA tRNA nucleotidyltransferase [Nitrospina sp.]|nr:CCA tRNA nucleotidyltransferase [Nitrospina sp.]MBT3414935.1 CCA tRNA nucleotidyltransferase [Nitrospina sp.]MBT3857292.1 CCA tRNA nucleotidyltransferase [Nitrospina sp.]MBT4103774.1 CCA tRNA nucleotidyltransferase [Nitrospina sp.]MBT4389064.1 CCA tRNA nucleotidyltransferase [Nitrospina sp.]
MDLSTPSILAELLNFSTSRNQKLYVVGGALRDRLSPKPDFDLTGENAAETGKCFSRSFNLTCIPLDKTPGRQTVRVVLDQKRHLDFTDLQGKNIEEDLSQRDFTINAMGQLLPDFLSGRENIVDPHNGQEDFKNKKIRVLQGPIFQSDPLRMLRAFRFAAVLNFEIAEETLSQISLHKTALMESAQERIWHELTLFFKSPDTLSLLQVMHDCGLLDCLFPIPDETSTFAQYQRLESLLREPKKTFPEYADELSTSGFLNQQYLLKVSILLKGIKEETETRSTESPGVAVAKDWNIRVSNAETKFMDQTMNGAGYLAKMHAEGNHDQAELYDLVKMTGEELPASVILFICGSHLVDVTPFCNSVLKFYYRQFLPVISKEPLLNGEDIIRQFRLSPCPLFGRILHCVQKAQVLGSISTREEAVTLAKDIIQSQSAESE